MKLFSEKVKYTSTNSSLNILCVEAFEEIFFGVYEIEINKSKYPVEKISEHNGNPVVSVPVTVEGVKRDYPFVLSQGKFEILFNGNNTLNEEYEIVDETITDVFLTEIAEEVEKPIIIPEIVDNRREILEQIQKAKKDAHRALQLEKSKNLKEIQAETSKKNKLLKNTLEIARENLVEEFVSISKKIREELIDENDNRFDEIKETIDNKINDLANTLSESLKTDFKQSSKIFDTGIRELVKELYDSLQPRIDKELKGIAIDIVEKVSLIEKGLDEKLKDKADITLIENVEGELNAVAKANIELNDKINKGVNKALSRVGNVDSKVGELAIALSEEVESKISKAEENITNYYSEKLKMLEEKTFDITEETRKYIVNLVTESRNNLISEIRKIKNEKPIEYIVEANGKKQSINSDDLVKDFDKKINSKIDTEVTRLRKYIAVYSGGGSVAMQFADGGTMNGNLTVVGTISASQYLGLPPINSYSNYLDLSGGTVVGNVSASRFLGDGSGLINLSASGSTNNIQYNDNGTFGAIPNNATNSLLFLSQVGDGVPSWQPIPVLGSLVYYFTPNSSDVSGYYKEVTHPYPTLSSFSVAGVTNDQLIRTYVTEPLNPNLYSIPAGQYSCHIHAQRTSGTKDVALRAEIWEVSSSGVDIALIALLGNSTILTGVVSEYFISEQILEYTLTSQSSRIATKIYTTVSGGGSAPSISIRVGDGSDSRTNLPAATIDATNYLPYTGATTDVDLGSFSIRGNSGTFTSLSANYMTLSGNPVATVVDPVRTVLTGNGVLSAFAISGAGSLTNPSALIVAIDAALQEPVADYSVNSGIITFTSPLANGAKAVVISPTNTLQVTEMIPADGSVSSAKLANDINISGTLGVTGAATFNSTARPTAPNVTGTPLSSSLMTRDDTRIDNTRQANYEISNQITYFTTAQLTTIGGTAGSNSSTGGVDLPFWVYRPNSTVDGASNYQALVGPHQQMSVGSTRSTCNWNQRKTLEILISPPSTSNGTTRYYWGPQAATWAGGSLAVKGVGFEIVANTLYAVCHNGTTKTTSGSGVALTLQTTYSVLIESDGSGGVRWWVNGTERTALIGGPTGNSSIANYGFCTEAINPTPASSTFVHILGLKFSSSY